MFFFYICSYNPSYMLHTEVNVGIRLCDSNEVFSRNQPRQCGDDVRHMGNCVSIIKLTWQTVSEMLDNNPTMIQSLEKTPLSTVTM